jgi:hypothetical protein
MKEIAFQENLSPRRCAAGKITTDKEIDDNERFLSCISSSEVLFLPDRWVKSEGYMLV